MSLETKTPFDILTISLNKSSKEMEDTTIDLLNEIYTIDIDIDTFSQIFSKTKDIRYLLDCIKKSLLFEDFECMMCIFGILTKCGQIEILEDYLSNSFKVYASFCDRWTLSTDAEMDMESAIRLEKMFLKQNRRRMSL